MSIVEPFHFSHENQAVCNWIKFLNTTDKLDTVKRTVKLTKEHISNNIGTWLISDEAQVIEDKVSERLNRIKNVFTV